MARIPTRFIGPLLITNSVVTRYTVAAAEKIVIRQIRASNPSGSAVTLTISIGTDATGTRLYDVYSIPANSILNEFCYIPVEATEIIQTNAGTTNIIVLVVTGDRLVLG